MKSTGSHLKRLAVALTAVGAFALASASASDLDLLGLSDSFEDTAANNSTSFFDAGSAGEWNIDLSTGNMFVSFVPEPSRALLQLAGLSFILLRRRRRFFA
ncbi:MAG: PEP-CTERM sorting domain-containing protein [Verrucomicrobiota bacterium]